MNSYMKCVICGVGKVTPTALPNRFVRYRTLHRVPVPENFEIPTCNRCFSEFIDEETARRLDEESEKYYREELLRRAKRAIRKIEDQRYPRNELEDSLGLPRGHLQKILSDKILPGPLLVAALTLFVPGPWVRAKSLGQRGYANVTRRGAWMQTRSFLSERATQGEVLLQAYALSGTVPPSERSVIVGEIAGVSGTRVLIRQYPPEGGGVQVLGAYVDDTWPEKETTDLVVASFMDIYLVQKDWGPALDLARRRALLKEEILKKRGLTFHSCRNKFLFPRVRE